jgi:hypothetical protein
MKVNHPASVWIGAGYCNPVFVIMPHFVLQCSMSILTQIKAKRQ